MTANLDPSDSSGRGLLRWVLLVVMVAVQLLVPAWMILGRELVLAKGEVYRFQTRPVDPYDAFRGRYVALGFLAGAESVPLAEGTVRRGQRVYVELGRNADGFATLVALHHRRPEDVASLKVKVLYLEGSGKGATVSLPFDRYYLPEDVAPEAESAYRELGRGQQDAWVDVRVLDGRGVLEELYVAGKPILELVKAQDDGSG